MVVKLRKKQKKVKRYLRSTVKRTLRIRCVWGGDSKIKKGKNQRR